MIFQLTLLQALTDIPRLESYVNLHPASIISNRLRKSSPVPWTGRLAGHQAPRDTNDRSLVPRPSRPSNLPRPRAAPCANLAGLVL